VPPFIATLSGFLAYRGLALVLSDARGLAPMGRDFALLGGRISASASLALILLGTVGGLFAIVERARRRQRFQLPSESSLRTAALLSVVAAAGILSAVVYREGMPVPVLIALITVAIGGLLLRRSRLGRYAFAIGENSEAA